MTARRMESGCPSACHGSLGCTDDWHLIGAAADDLYRRDVDAKADRVVARVGWGIAFTNWFVSAVSGGIIYHLFLR